MAAVAPPLATPVALQPQMEVPTKLLERLRLIAGALFGLTVLGAVTGNFSVFTIVSLICFFLGFRAATKPNISHLRAFVCWNSCLATVAVIVAVVALAVTAPLLACSCDTECVDAAYDVIQEGRSWALNHTTANGSLVWTNDSAPSWWFPPPPPAPHHQGDHLPDAPHRHRALAHAVRGGRDGEVDGGGAQPHAAVHHHACPYAHAAGLGGFGRHIAHWLRRHGGHGGHGGRWHHRGHPQPAAPREGDDPQPMPMPMPVDMGPAQEGGYNTGIVPPPIGSKVPPPETRHLSRHRQFPARPPITAVPQGEVAPAHPAHDPRRDPPPPPGPWHKEQDEVARVGEEGPMHVVHRHFTPQPRLGAVLRSMFHALIHPFRHPPRPHGHNEHGHDDHMPPTPEWHPAEGPHADEEEEGVMLPWLPPHDLDSTTTSVTLEEDGKGQGDEVEAWQEGKGHAPGGVRRLIGMRRLMAMEDHPHHNHRGSHYGGNEASDWQHGAPPAPGAQPMPGAPGTWGEMMEERRRKYRMHDDDDDATRHKYGNEEEGTSWGGAAEGIDDDGQRMLVWFLDWSGTLSRAQLHASAQRLCAIGPWVVFTGLAIIAFIFAVHVYAARVARTLIKHPWYIQADAEQKRLRAERRALRRGGAGTLPPAGAVMAVPQATTVPAPGTPPAPTTVVADPHVMYRFVPGHGFMPASAGSTVSSALGDMWSSLTGWMQARRGYAPVAGADVGAGDVELGAVRGPVNPAGPGFVIAHAASGPRVGGDHPPAPTDVDPRAPAAYVATASAPTAPSFYSSNGMYPTVPATTGSGYVVSHGVGPMVAGAQPGTSAAVPAGSAFTYAVMPPRRL